MSLSIGKLTIQFSGICTHFRANGALLPEGVGHRVVLVNAYQENLILNNTIPPHVGTLITPDRTVPLAGCTLKIANALGTSCVYEPSFDCIPNLTEMNEDLGPPSPALVAGQNPGLASCYFDFSSGTFSGCQLNQAATTSVVVETLDEPRIEQKPFPGTFGVSCGWKIPSGSKIFVNHQALGEPAQGSTSVAEHFLLHYLTAEQLPADPKVPAGCSCRNFCGGPPPPMVGVSCSNSNYP